MSLVDAANALARSNAFYRKSGILAIPASKAPFNNITAMWNAGWKIVLVYTSKRNTLWYCYKRRGLVPSLWARLLTLFK
jgi:hypothetical protein